jgi:hypothetical protein
MCIVGGSSVSIFDRYRQAAASSPTGKIDVFGKPAPVAQSPIAKITDPIKKANEEGTKKAVLGSAAPTAIFADRIEGTPVPRGVTNPLYRDATDLFGTLTKMLGITPPKSPITNDPTKVAAGRIGHAYGASDLRIGR